MSPNCLMGRGPQLMRVHLSLEKLESRDFSKRIWSVLLIFLLIAATAARAQSVEPYQQYATKLKTAERVEPLTDELFGEQVSLYNGSTEFSVVDVDIPGNSMLPVTLRRKFNVQAANKVGTNFGGFANWDIDVPTIDGTFASSIGWVTSDNTYARCSDPSSPYTGTPSFSADDVWSGNRLNLPGEGSQQLYVNNEPKVPAVQDGLTYHWITQSHYRATCLSSINNGQTGEGFLVLSPNGTKYYFDWMISRAATTVKKPFLTTLSSIGRTHLFLAATRVVDRFGNWVSYTYTGDKLTRIESNDGRWIDIGYNGENITAVTSSQGLWTYGYTSAQYQQLGITSSYLSSVTRPDGSKWTYGLSGTLYAEYLPTLSPVPDFSQAPDEMWCRPPGEPAGYLAMTMTHPSGATGEFEFGYYRHYRTRVPKSCTAYAISQTEGYYDLVIPNYFDNYTLVKKKLSGAAVSEQQWTYDYGYVFPIGFCFRDGHCNDQVACPVGRECPPNGSKYVSVVETTGVKHRYRFGVQYGINEGRLLSTEIIENGIAKKVTSYAHYAPTVNDRAPSRIGGQLSSTSFDPLANLVIPIKSTVIAQDGVTFSVDVSANCNGAGTYCFDGFARPTKVTKSSMPTP